MTIWEKFIETARTFRDCEAVNDGESRLTYGELETQARTISQTLAKLPPSATVLGVYGRKNVQLIPFLLGVSAAGRTWIYLDPADSDHRLGALVRKTKMECLLQVEDDERDFWHSSPVRVVTLRECLVSPKDGILAPQKKEPCCLVQTGGTSSEPRLVALGHQALLHNVENFGNSLRVGAGDRLGMTASPKVTAALSSLYGSLLHGACLQPFSVREFGLRQMGLWLQKERITILHLTPSLFRVLVRECAGFSFPDLRAVKLGGEQAFVSDAKLFRKVFPGAQLWNGWGMSEAAGNICHFCVPEDSGDGKEMLAVGKVLPGHELLVVDGEGREQKEGEAGEIWVRSAFLADGYWGKAEETAAKFQLQPDGRSELKSGDLGRMAADGSLILLGRSDRMIKLNGIRVDLDVVEGVLLSLPEVRNAVVLLQGEAGALRLKACVETDESSDWVRERLAAELPLSLGALLVEVFSTLPRTDGGKVDRQLLLREGGAGLPDQSVPPRSETEARLLTMWRDVLPDYKGGVYGNFFENGGDSLDALNLSARVDKGFSFATDAAWMIQHPTIAQMAEFFDVFQEKSDPKQGKKSAYEVEARLLPLRKGQGKVSWIFLPGGYATENELLLFARLSRLVKHPGEMHGLRFNFMSPAVPSPGSFDELVEKVATEARDKLKDKEIIWVGECVASGLAWAAANRFREMGGQSRGVILLDPWKKGFSVERGDLPREKNIYDYYQLVKYAPWPMGSGPLDGIYSGARWTAEGKSLEELGARCHRVSGDHNSYLKDGALQVAELLDQIAEGRGPDSAVFLNVP